MHNIDRARNDNKKTTDKNERKKILYNLSKALVSYRIVNVYPRAQQQRHHQQQHRKKAQQFDRKA